MTKHTGLSEKDKTILRQLELDSRKSFVKIGKKTRMSQQRVSYSVHSMIQKKIIDGFYTLIDYSKLNAINFRVYFRVTYAHKEKFNKLVTYLKKHPNTSWVAICGGRYDIVCDFLAPNTSSFNKSLKTIISVFPKQLQNYTILTTIVMRNFGRKYLFDNSSNNPNEVIIGGDREPEHFDDIDLNILDMISEDARISAVDIANKLDLTTKTVIKRIKKLISSKTITGFKPILNLSETGHIEFLLLIKCHNVFPKLEDELVNYLKRHPNVVSLVKTLGEWDFEIHIESRNWYIYRTVVMEIRQRFPMLIQEMDTVPIDNINKTKYFPAFLLEKNNNNLLNHK